MKKRIMLVALMFAFSVQFLHAQRGGGCPVDDVCDPTPTPTPIPTATPTPIPTPTPPESGSVGLKYVVLSVTYAPPGSSSTATYSNSTLFGSTLALSSSFKNSTTISTVLESSPFSIPGISLLNSSTISSSFEEQVDSTLSIALMDETTESFIVRGPLSSAVGVDHDEDVIWLWLNPALTFQMPASNVIQWSSVGFDNRDPTNDIDIFPIRVKFLNGHAPIPQEIQNVLSRSWVCVGSNDPQCGPGLADDPGLTQADFVQILKADPFTDPTYVIDVLPGTSCTTDQRFCLAINHSFAYPPPPPGGQPITQNFTETRTAVAKEEASASISITAGITSQKFDVTHTFLADFLDTLQVANTLTLTNKIDLLNSQQALQTSAFSITGPTTADNYTGPVELDVFQDNVYGTFMFGAIPEPTFDVDVSPASQSVPQGGCVNYSVTVVALVSGFNQTVTFSVSGLPTNATGVFTPPSVTGAGSSILQVCAASSTPLGTGPLVIKGATATESHTTNPGLTVTPPPDFTLSATPASQSVVVGGTASYTVSVTPLNGFTGTVALSASVSCGATATLNPASLSGSGTSTLTITTVATTPLGSCAIAIVGASGALSHPANVTLTVNSVPSGDFSLSASPGSQTVNAGDSASYTISSTALNGFTGTVSLTASGPGGDVFVDLFPASISGNGAATLSVSTDSNTSAGTYFISITGTSGSLSHSTSVRLTVNTPPGGCDPICPIQ